MPGFGQAVIGPPGSGKSTYCAGIQQFYRAIGRNAVIFNLDPANENVIYDAAADITDLVSADKVAAELSLGPNGSLLYAMEYLEKNIDWLEARLAECKGKYVVFDFPGQIELYTHNECIRNIVQQLTRKHNYRITAVNLVDSHYCADPSKYIAALLTSLTMMLQLELPAINVFSKIDLIEQYGKLDFNLDYFTEVQDLSWIARSLHKDPRMKKHARLHDEICSLIEDFSLLAFHTLDIQNKESVMRLNRAIDKSNGYIYANIDANRAVYQAVVGKPVDDARWTLHVQERYMGDRSGSLEQ